MRLKRRSLLFWISIVIIFLIIRLWRRSQQRTFDLILMKHLNFYDIFKTDIKFHEPLDTNDKCSMSTCFNWTKCANADQLKVYVYPSNPTALVSPVYEKILKVLRESYLYTNDPNSACLFFLSIDTIDRDKLSENYVKDIAEQIAALPQDIWANGTNHIIFNLYFGSFPDYGYNLGFDTGNAMLAWASANAQEFRNGFDVSFSLFHKEHSFRTIPQKLEIQALRRDKYTVSFKGKRYVFGIGSETRNILYKLHDNESTIIATTCKHTILWKKFEDDRCVIDNENYDRWDYNDLLKSSTFCFTPRGRRLGSFRFLESLGMGCIPIVLSDDWLLPFFEVIDWSKASILWHEKNVLFITDFLSELPDEKVFEMKRQSLLLYHRYFSSIEKIVISSVESVLERIRRQHVNFEPTNWNLLVNLNPKERGFTIILQAILRESTRLNRVLIELSKLIELRKIIVLWPKDRGPLLTMTTYDIQVDVTFVETERVDQSEFLKVKTDFFIGDFVLFFDERIQFDINILNLAFVLARNNPSKMLVFYAAHYFNLENNGGWNLTRPLDIVYSFGWLIEAFVHKQFIRQYQIQQLGREKLFNWFTPSCHAILFNFAMADWSLNAPMLITSKSNNTGLNEDISWIGNRNINICFNKIVHEMYADNVPLISSKLIYSLP